MAADYPLERTNDFTKTGATRLQDRSYRGDGTPASSSHWSARFAARSSNAASVPALHKSRLRRDLEHASESG